MHELAIELNEILKGTIVDEMLSDVGRRMFFPKGIVAQSAEAKLKATRFNATIGMATSDGQPMYLSDIYNQFSQDSLTPAEIFSYAAGGGDPQLRALWKEMLFKKNPSLQGKHFSLPIVTGGLTHGLSCLAQLFAQSGDTLVIPDLAWDNYELIFAQQVNATVKTFPLYDDKGGFNVAAMKEVLASVSGGKARILLNFPNNPTGYTPSETEMNAIAEALIDLAEDGMKLMVLCDDAYFGLFFEEETAKEGLFTRIANAHDNIFAIKCDAATKEDMVWGFRIGFLTYASKSLTPAQYDALNKKTLGIIRSTVSNCDRPGQSLLLHAMRDGKNYLRDKENARLEMAKRFHALTKALEKHAGSELLKPYPYNSGYFMAFKCKGSSEQLRQYLLEKYQVGCISIKDDTLRLAYCSVECDKIPELVDLVYQAAGEAWK
ncbi:aspartate/tyrosine/aromatic aminotransferase [Sphaerochaeta pleomorpha str. Grapes]|uniref:Aspartate/tyrosine/aromatic aminotransferase n=1 Tax=Sphaerochaeta pleomorpha (strain ATCC BAA-1885 / DSM 22778 / Grapes) TaxID=158190 RepID=G8QR10_SPHPG|nr:aminotransferase class I/II-fold pyridoxal phosphate-dependent enzyme [Sphaerochaeta pleomorpha]AEV29858.1 aspartate/tyrosine/aromatic aminotransferase [Sphaerochaeta pleomorpha str. Grapes]